MDKFGLYLGHDKTFDKINTYGMDWMQHIMISAVDSNANFTISSKSGVK